MVRTGEPEGHPDSDDENLPKWKYATVGNRSADDENNSTYTDDGGSPMDKDQ